MMTDYLKKYPWLRTQNLYTGKVEDDYCALNDIPKGWVLAFGKMFCEEMDVVLKDLGISDKFFVAQMKEKFGSLRFYPSVRDEKIRKVVKKYEALIALADGKAAKIIVPTDVVEMAKNNIIFSETTGLGDNTKPDTTIVNIEKKTDLCCDEQNNEE